MEMEILVYCWDGLVKLPGPHGLEDLVPQVQTLDDQVEQSLTSHSLSFPKNLQFQGYQVTEVALVVKLMAASVEKPPFAALYPTS